MATTSTPELAIQELLDDVDQLHSCPNVVYQLLALIDDGDFDIAEVVKCLEADPALAASLLRLVNSSHYGLLHKVSSVQRAVTFLGRRSLRLAIINFRIVDSLMRGTPAVMYHDYWRRALTMASAVRVFWARCNVGQVEAFSAGLFADLGALVFAQSRPSQYPPMFLELDHHTELVRAEQDMFGFDHAAVGAALLSRWHFPEELTEVVARHLECAPDRTPLDTSVYVASLLADALWTYSTSKMPELQRILDIDFNIATDGLTSLAQECKAHFVESKELFAVDVAGEIDSNSLERQAQTQFEQEMLDGMVDLQSLANSAEHSGS